MSYFSSSTEVSDSLLEVSLEPGALLSLHLSVLDGRPAQVFVQLHRLVGSDGGLVRGGLLPQPEVDVLLHPPVVQGRLHSLAAAGAVGGGGEDDVGVAGEELAPGLSGEGNHLHVLDPPHVEPGHVARYVLEHGVHCHVLTHLAVCEVKMSSD